MTREDWITNLENAASEAEKRFGSAAVTSVFSKFGAHSIEELCESDYPAVWDELSFMAEED